MYGFYGKVKLGLFSKLSYFAIYKIYKIKLIYEIDYVKLFENLGFKLEKHLF